MREYYNIITLISKPLGALDSERSAFCRYIELDRESYQRN